MEEELPSGANARTNRKVQSPATATLLTILSIGLVILATLIHSKRRQIIQEQNSNHGDSSVSTMSDNNWGGSVCYGHRDEEQEYSDGPDDCNSDGLYDEFTYVSGGSIHLEAGLETSMLETIFLD
jgi:hypothetical protein